MVRERELHPKIQELMIKERPFLEEVAKNAGLNVTDYTTYDSFWGFKDAVLIHTILGLKRAEWITDALWDRFLTTRQKVYYFVKGEAGFGEPESIELTAIGSGLFLKTLITDMELKKSNKSGLKMHFYSAVSLRLMKFYTIKYSSMIRLFLTSSEPWDLRQKLSDMVLQDSLAQ